MKLPVMKSDTESKGDKNVIEVKSYIIIYPSLAEEESGFNYTLM